jgi:hypothetical protein
MERYEKPMLAVVLLDEEDIIITSDPTCESDCTVDCTIDCSTDCPQVIVLPEI